MRSELASIQVNNNFLVYQLFQFFLSLLATRNSEQSFLCYIWKQSTSQRKGPSSSIFHLNVTLQNLLVYLTDYVQCILYVYCVHNLKTIVYICTCICICISININKIPISIILSIDRSICPSARPQLILMEIPVFLVFMWHHGMATWLTWPSCNHFWSPKSQWYLLF